MAERKSTARPNRRRWLLAALAAAALLFAFWQPISPERLLTWGEGLLARPWTVVALVFLQAALLALALPGSLVLWLIAPFYPTWQATLLLTVGSVSGALGGYALARWAGGSWRPGPGGHRIMRLLAERGDFLTQVTLRVLPGFPHSVVNHGAGLLALPLGRFIWAAVVGLATKWWVYSAAIHALVGAVEAGEPLQLEQLLPLFVLALLLLVGAVMRRRLQRRR